MSQTAFAFDPPASRTAPAAATTIPPSPAVPRSQAAADPTAYAIGWDHARYGVAPPAALLDPCNPVHQGWSAGRCAFAGRQRPATPAVRDWLGLRLQAWLSGIAFEDVQVTPHFLAQIDAPRCPVTDDMLTRESGACTDATIVRLNDTASFAAGNLAVVSRRAALALAELRLVAAGADVVQAALDRAESARRSGTTDLVGGLAAVHWDRLAQLCSFTTWLPDEQVAALPLTTLAPNRVRVLQPAQALKVVLTLLFCQPHYARTLCDLAARLPAGTIRRAFQVFMHTLLARRLAAAPLLSSADARSAMLQAWSHPLVRQRWRALATVLDEHTIEPLLRRALQRGSGIPTSLWLSQDTATEGWALAPDQARPASAAAARDFGALH